MYFIHIKNRRQRKLRYNATTNTWVAGGGGGPPTGSWRRRGGELGGGGVPNKTDLISCCEWGTIYLQ
jgi:hypothetical protein